MSLAYVVSLVVDNEDIRWCSVGQDHSRFLLGDNSGRLILLALSSDRMRIELHLLGKVSSTLFPLGPWLLIYSRLLQPPR